jgi:hypothetical protein
MKRENGNENCNALLRLSRPLSCCCGLNQPRALDNGWVLAMLTALRVALVQRKRVPLSVSSGRFPWAAHERTLTASAGRLLSMERERQRHGWFR